MKKIRYTVVIPESKQREFEDFVENLGWETEFDVIKETEIEKCTGCGVNLNICKHWGGLCFQKHENCRGCITYWSHRGAKYP